MTAIAALKFPVRPLAAVLVAPPTVVALPAFPANAKAEADQKTE